MNDLISRSALLEALDKLYMAALRKTGSSVETIYELDHLAMLVKDAPAVDAEAVRHGRWIEVVTYDQDGDCLELEYKCSECGRLEGLDDEPYCNCGAKMDAEVEG